MNDLLNSLLFRASHSISLKLVCYKWLVTILINQKTNHSCSSLSVNSVFLSRSLSTSGLSFEFAFPIFLLLFECGQVREDSLIHSPAPAVSQSQSKAGAVSFPHPMRRMKIYSNSESGFKHARRIKLNPTCRLTLSPFLREVIIKMHKCDLFTFWLVSCRPLLLYWFG